MKEIIKALLDVWPVICVGLAGVVTAFCLYLKTRLSYKTKLIEKDTETLELQKIIVEGSYIICPDCGKKVFLSSCKIHTGGIKEDENKKTR